MASTVDICNLALAHIGDAARVSSIAPPDGTVQAEHCARFYPIALQAMLEPHPWRFATRRAELAPLPGVVCPASWEYAYALPAKLLRPLKVLPAGGLDSAPSSKYEVETLEDGTGVIYTNEDDATLQFIASVTDTTKFSPTFVVALSHSLAAFLAGPIIKGRAGTSVADKELQMVEQLFLPRAKAADANSRHGSAPIDRPATIESVRR